MSLAKTFMKVAIGVAVAKGVSTLAKRAGSGGTSASAGRSSQGTSGGLGDLMGDILGTSGKSTTTRAGRRTTSRSGDSLLDEVLADAPTTGRSTAARGTRATAPKGGFDDVLDQMTGARTGRGGAGGGIGDLLGSMLGGSTAAASGVTRSSGGTLRLDPVERDREISAALMLKAIIQAVKCDGDLDADEKRKLMDAMGDATEAEINAVNAELAAPVDVDALVRLVPNGLEAEIYLASLSAINLDHQAEAQYLHALAQALELAPHEVNALHDRVGAPLIYR